jgi:hypothetical protein
MGTFSASIYMETSESDKQQRGSPPGCWNPTAGVCRITGLSTGRETSGMLTEEHEQTEALDPIQFSVQSY